MSSTAKPTLFSASPRSRKEGAEPARTVRRLNAQLQATKRELAQAKARIGAEVSARRHVERALEVSLQRYRFMADSLPQIVWTAKPDGRIDYYNQRWFDYTGLTLAESLDWGWQVIVHPDDLKQCVERWKNALTTGSPHEVECRFRCGSDGSYRWHLGRAFPMRNDGGEIVQWVGTCTDIHEQKLAKELLERRVAERTAELRTVNTTLAEEIAERELVEQANAEILANSLDVICSIDKQGCFTNVSAGCEKVWGYTPEELIARAYMDFVHPEDHDLTRAAAATIMAGYPARGFENRYIRKDGSTVPITWTANWSEVCRTMFCVARDMSEAKRTHAELMRAKEVAEAANRAKSDFLANMSHEIRTPMNGILGMVDLALNSGPNPLLERYLCTIQNSAESLLTVINDILDFSKIEAGKLEMESIPFDLRATVGDTIATFSGRAANKGLQLTWEIDPEVPSICVGDPSRLRQILLNLIGNALKFTERGTVSLRVILQAFDAESLILHFYVKDTGIGIADEVQAGIFEAFQQADTSTSRKFGGTGLGLSICRSLVGQMGGRIALESTLGQGSTFHFTAQFGMADLAAQASISEAAQVPASPTSRRSLRILLAEDNRVNQEVATSILRSAGHLVMVAQNGREAVRLIEEDEFDIVLMDVQMPEMDGLEATGVIRSIERERGCRTPIVAMTAHAMRGDKERCLAGGMDDYLSKPFQRQSLTAVLDRWTGRTAALESQPENVLSFPATTSVSSPAGLEALQELASDLEFITNLQESWNQEGPATLMQLEHAVAALDFTHAARAAHTLKGMFGSVGDDRGHELARSVEVACQQSDARVVLRSLPDLSEELEIVSCEIARLLGGGGIGGRA